MILFSIVLFPQIRKTLICKDVSGISPWMFTLTIIANLDALWYATLINQPPLQVKYVIGLAMGAISLFIYNKYKK